MIEGTHTISEQEPPAGAKCSVWVNGKEICRPNVVYYNPEYCHFEMGDYYLPKDAGHITWKLYETPTNTDGE